MTKPFSTNPKLAEWASSPQLIKTITEARRLLDLLPEEEGEATNALRINLLNVYSRHHPEVIDPKQLVDESSELLLLRIDRRHYRHTESVDDASFVSH